MLITYVNNNYSMHCIHNTDNKVESKYYLAQYATDMWPDCELQIVGYVKQLLVGNLGAEKTYNGIPHRKAFLTKGASSTAHNIELIETNVCMLN